MPALLSIPSNSTVPAKRDCDPSSQTSVAAAKRDSDSDSIFVALDSNPDDGIVIEQESQMPKTESAADSIKAAYRQSTASSNNEVDEALKEIEHIQALQKEIEQGANVQRMLKELVRLRSNPNFDRENYEKKSIEALRAYRAWRATAGNEAKLQKLQQALAWQVLILIVSLLLFTKSLPYLFDFLAKLGANAKKTDQNLAQPLPAQTSSSDLRSMDTVAAILGEEELQKCKAIMEGPAYSQPESINSKRVNSARQELSLLEEIKLTLSVLEHGTGPYIYQRFTSALAGLKKRAAASFFGVKTKEGDASKQTPPLNKTDQSPGSSSTHSSATLTSVSEEQKLAAEHAAAEEMFRRQVAEGKQVDRSSEGRSMKSAGDNAGTSGSQESSNAENQAQTSSQQQTQQQTSNSEVGLGISGTVQKAEELAAKSENGQKIFTNLEQMATKTKSLEEKTKSLEKVVESVTETVESLDEKVAALIPNASSSMQRLSDSMRSFPRPQFTRGYSADIESSDSEGSNERSQSILPRLDLSPTAGKGSHEPFRNSPFPRARNIFPSANSGADDSLDSEAETQNVNIFSIDPEVSSHHHKYDSGYGKGSSDDAAEARDSSQPKVSYPRKKLSPNRGNSEAGTVSTADRQNLKNGLNPLLPSDSWNREHARASTFNSYFAPARSGSDSTDEARNKSQFEFSQQRKTSSRSLEMKKLAQSFRAAKEKLEKRKQNSGAIDTKPTPTLE